MKFIFSFGIIDKKILLPFLYAINRIFVDLINNYVFLNNNIRISPFIDETCKGVGLMYAIFIPYIFKFKNKNKEAICSKENIKYISILVLLDVLYYGTMFCVFLFPNSYNGFISTLFVKEAFVMILIIIATIIFLKYKYYIHHIISLIIFFVLSICIDLILNNYNRVEPEGGVKKCLLEAFLSVAEIIDFCYMIYLMRSKLYNYWTMIFIFGVIILTINIFYLIISLIIEKSSDNQLFTINFGFYFKEINAGYIIIQFIFAAIFSGFILYSSMILILYYLSINHLMLNFILYKTWSVLITYTYDNKWFSLIPIFFQILSLLFYLEILEYNFCKLNKNTKKNILFREKNEMLVRESIGSSNNNIIDIGQGYHIHNEKDDNQDNKEIIELSEKIGNDIEEENILREN